MTWRRNVQVGPGDPRDRGAPQRAQDPGRRRRRVDGGEHPRPSGHRLAAGERVARAAGDLLGTALQTPRRPRARVEGGVPQLAGELGQVDAAGGLPRVKRRAARGGLRPALAAARAGKRILLANKESLVMSGDLFMREVSAHDATLLPSADWSLAAGSASRSASRSWGSAAPSPQPSLTLVACATRLPTAVCQALAQ